MTPLFKKLNYRSPLSIIVLNSPLGFESELQSMMEETTIFQDMQKPEQIAFALAFVTKKKEVEAVIRQLAPKLIGDAVLWFCYPKGTSKKYTCDFNRDTGWNVLGTYNLEPVRQVAIDEDWSALRFRKVEFIKSMTRNQLHMLSEEGKNRAV